MRLLCPSFRRGPGAPDGGTEPERRPVRRGALICLLLLLPLWGAAQPPAPVSYRLAFPEPEHRWLQVEATFTGLDAGPAEIRMSRSSPGRYALHEFAKNVIDVRAYDGAGRELAFSRPDPHQWDVAGHDGTVRFVYRIFGDRVDGTYLAVDTTHAHMNIPATLAWARGLADRPVEVRFEAPAGSGWQVATQLFPTSDPFTFTAPNLQYLLDSPAEMSRFTLRTFTVADREGGTAPVFRVAVHHEGTDAQVDAYAAATEKIVREARAVFGAFPAFDAGTYTFIADYLPYASGDGMEHRNSTILTASASLSDPEDRLALLNTVAHEFFHAWNVERIRPASLEPFDFERANMSGELWLAEGVTSYYDGLLMHRAGLQDLAGLLTGFEQAINVVALSPGRRFRSAVEMSQQAPFVDAARSVDRTPFANTFISYYTWGAAIGLALDLDLRAHTGGRASLDDFMRAMWLKFGRPAGRPGYVPTPYTLDAVRATLADVAGDASFANGFIDRYVASRKLPDYAGLLQRAGLSLRRRNPGSAWLGDVAWRYSDGGAVLQGLAPFGSPVYEAGLDVDDVLVSLDREGVSGAERLDRIVRRRRPGETVPITFIRRGERVEGSLTFEEDPRLEIVPLEPASAAQREFRDAWLSSRSR